MDSAGNYSPFHSFSHSPALAFQARHCIHYSRVYRVAFAHAGETVDIKAGRSAGICALTDLPENFPFVEKFTKLCTLCEKVT